MLCYNTKRNGTRVMVKTSKNKGNRLLSLVYKGANERPFTGFRVLGFGALEFWAVGRTVYAFLVPHLQLFVMIGCQGMLRNF